MNMKISVMLLAGLFVLPAVVFARSDRAAIRQEHRTERQEHRQTQQSENKALRESLKGKTPEEKKAAWEANRATQHTENVEFNQKMFEENKSALQSRLAENTKLSDAEKADLLNAFEARYKENSSKGQQRYEENSAFFDQIASDTTMTQEQKKAAIKAHFEANKAAAIEHREEMKALIKAKHGRKTQE